MIASLYDNHMYTTCIIITYHKYIYIHHMYNKPPCLLLQPAFFAATMAPFILEARVHQPQTGQVGPSMGKSMGFMGIYMENHHF